MKFLNRWLLTAMVSTTFIFCNTWSTIKQIAFDIDGVIAQRDWQDTRKEIKEGLAVIWSARTNNSWKVAMCYILPRGEKPTGEEFLLTLNNESARDKVRHIVDAKKLISGMQEIIEKLYNDGYILTVATNQTREAFERLIKHSEFATIFSYFDLDKSQFARHKPTVKKPSKQYFTEYLAKSNTLQPDEILFVDDTKKNVIAAEKCGIISIHFTSVEQFRQVLNKTIPQFAA